MYEIIFCILSTSVMELHTSKHKKYKCKFIQSLIYNFYSYLLIIKQSLLPRVKLSEKIISD